jgi:DNA processing protein
MALEHQIALTLIEGLGNKKTKKIIEFLEDEEDFFRMKKSSLYSLPGIGEKIILQLNREQILQEAYRYLDVLEKQGIHSLYYRDSNYPTRLKECVDAPLLLFQKGNMQVNSKRVISVVGTRNATNYGKKIVDELIATLQDKNCIVVSGLAYGIDVYTHQKCLDFNLETIGVLGHGLDRVYPYLHKGIAEKMCEKGGLLTEFLPGTKPDREHFPMRNRIVAGMTDATIVVESGEKGGSLITAELANDYARDVFAYPGNIDQEYSKGCNYLIQKNKAHLITNGEQFLEIMNWTENILEKQSQTILFPTLSLEEQSIYNLLEEKGEQSADQLAMHLKFPIYKINQNMFELEMKMLIKTMPGNRYRTTNGLKT